MLANADITIYNRFLDPIEKIDKYLRTQIKGVNWFASKGVNKLRTGTETADAVIVLIPLKPNAENKTYKKPKAWQSTPNVDMSKYFTFNSGDLIVKGLVTYDVNVGGVKGLEKAFDDVYTITSVDTEDRGSPNVQHFRVGAR
jgi:hypothetical protein